MFALYIYANAFASASFVAHLLMRVTTLVLFVVGMTQYRKAIGDVTDAFGPTIAAFAIVLSQEI